MAGSNFNPTLESLLNEEQFFAIHKFTSGKANASEQLLAFKTIAEKLCGIATMSFCPDNKSITDFNEGKRWVAGMLVKIHNTDLDYFRHKKNPPAIPAISKLI